jgi:predicted neuraminidase
MNLKAIINSEFVFLPKEASFASCHSSTIVETPTGLICAWFAGPYEGHPDVEIWLSRRVNGSWTSPVKVADGFESNHRYPAWNPVLYYENGNTILFYKVGPHPYDWWGKYLISMDNGETWSPPQKLPNGFIGPVRNKPILLGNGDLLCPSSTEKNGWRIHMEFTPDVGKTWERTKTLNNKDVVSAIQPTILFHPKNKLQLLCRTRNSFIYTAWSTDNGRTWTTLEPIDLPNPNSAIDAVTMQDGRHLLVYNHIPGNMDQSKRNTLNVAISEDGINWEAALLLENEMDIIRDKELVLNDVGLIHTESEYSYPAIIQTNDGNIHITYTWKRQTIKHVTVGPIKIESKPFINGNWPE